MQQGWENEYTLVGFIVVAGVVALHTGIQLWLIGQNARPATGVLSTHSQPLSIVIAARNEAHNLPALFQSLAGQTYPKHLWEVLFGDDASTDDTPEVAKAFAEQQAWFRYVRIDSQLAETKGKTNVLAQLFRLARHEIVLITDADIILPPTWASTMAGTLAQPGVGVVSGPTLAQGPTCFAKMQQLDWLMGAAAINALAHHQVPLTAVGNNMGVRRSAYAQTGGYENLPFSLTEDYLLFSEIVAKGWRFRWVHLRQALNQTHALRSLAEYVHQRKRWYAGGRNGPWYGALLYALHAAVYPMLALHLCISPTPWVLGLMSVKWLLDAAVLAVAARPLAKLKLLAWYPVYPIYFNLSLVVLVVAFLLPFKVRWKGREYATGRPKPTINT